MLSIKLLSIVVMKRLFTTIIIDNGPIRRQKRGNKFCIRHTNVIVVNMVAYKFTPITVQYILPLEMLCSLVCPSVTFYPHLDFWKINIFAEKMRYSEKNLIFRKKSDTIILLNSRPS